VRKSWTLVELHQYVFDYFKELFLRWYTKDEAELKAKEAPAYKHPETGEMLTAETIDELFKTGDLAK